MKFIFKACLKQAHIEVKLVLPSGKPVPLCGKRNRSPVHFSTAYFLAKLRALDILALPYDKEDADFHFDSGFIYRDLIFENVFNEVAESTNVRINQHLSRFNQLIRAELTKHGFTDYDSAFENRVWDNDNQVRFASNEIDIYINDELTYSTSKVIEPTPQLATEKAPLKVEKPAKIAPSTFLKKRYFAMAGALTASITLLILPTKQHSEIVFSTPNAAAPQSIAVSPLSQHLKNKVPTYTNALAQPIQAHGTSATSTSLSIQPSSYEAHTTHHQALVDGYKKTGKYEYISELKDAISQLPTSMKRSKLFFNSALLVAIADHEINDAYALVEQMQANRLFTPDYREQFLVQVLLEDNNWYRIIDQYKDRTGLSYEQSLALKKAYAATGQYDKVAEVNALQLAQLAKLDDVLIDNDNTQIEIDDSDVNDNTDDNGQLNTNDDDLKEEVEVSFKQIIIITNAISILSVDSLSPTSQAVTDAVALLTPLLLDNKENRHILEQVAIYQNTQLQNLVIKITLLIERINILLGNLEQVEDDIDGQIET